MQTIQASLDPLTFREAEAHKRDNKNEVTKKAVVRYLCELREAKPADFVARYFELTDKAPRIIAVPYQKNVQEKMLVPLHGAISCYMLGNYYGTIALCGLVSEMLTILLFEMHHLRYGNESLTRKKQIEVWGRTFEKLGQEDRIEKLSQFKFLREDGTEKQLLNDPEVEKFETIRRLRRVHLHLLSHNVEERIADARKCYQCAVDLFHFVFRVEPKDGILKMRSQVLDYVKQGPVSKRRKRP